jgi:hypothetical protein
MWSKQVCSTVAGSGRKLELSSHVLVDPTGRREREIGGTREEPLDGAVSDLGVRVHPREGPPWLPLGRVEREGVERVAPTMAGEWWRER